MSLASVFDVRRSLVSILVVPDRHASSPRIYSMNNENSTQIRVKYSFYQRKKNLKN
jgi:hypothetical protein